MLFIDSYKFCNYKISWIIIWYCGCKEKQNYSCIRVCWSNFSKKSAIMMSLVVRHSQTQYLSEYLNPECYVVRSFPEYKTNSFLREDSIYEFLPFFSVSKFAFNIFFCLFLGYTKEYVIYLSRIIKVIYILIFSPLLQIYKISS